MSRQSRPRAVTTHAAVVDFDENSPRPPVPGGEEIPRSVQSFNKGTLRGPVSHVDREHEPEGRCGSGCEFREAGGGGGGRAPPPCLLWARNLHTLLADTEGVGLFRMYLEQEGRAHADALNFWFACEGLKKQTDKEKISQLVKVIYRKYITASAQLGIREELRREVTVRIREGAIDQTVFDAAQNDVGQRITATTYPNFLKSDIYLNYVQQLPYGGSNDSTNLGSSSSGSSSGGGASREGLQPSASTAGLLLPTLHEDAELVVAAEDRQKPLPLTRDMLAATQGRRAFDLRPRPEAFAGMYLQQQSSGQQQTMLRAYSSYNPVSRQDSELQSLSSDARTDSDAMSCTDSSLDGASLNPSKVNNKRFHQRQARAIKENAHINRDLTPYLIPRTQRANSMPSSLQPDEFARVLTLKLEAVLRAQEAQEALEARLSQAALAASSAAVAASSNVVSVASLADVIREKLQLEDSTATDCDQAILDMHVSRVWADRTPCRSPPVDVRRKAPVHPYQARPGPRYQRKEKDVFSTFSSDSGNVHDFPPEKLDSASTTSSGRHLPKSKSIPECVDSHKIDPYSVSGHESRSRHQTATGNPSNPRRLLGSTSSVSTTRECYTDSGVSVVSDSHDLSMAGGMVGGNNDGTTTEWVVSWLKDSDRHRWRHSSRKERSGSLERQIGMTEAGTTMTQLEEARRRLMVGEEERWRGNMGVVGTGGAAGGARQRFPNSSIPSNNTSNKMVDLSWSAQSTLRRPMQQQHLRKTSTEDAFTTVMFSFCDEQFPYRTKLSGTQPTLRQFKEILPKKGNYRFYFKTECEEEEARVIQQEVSDDNELLPLWEGKLIAQVKAVE